MVTERIGYVIVGLPGSGKSVAGSILTTELDAVNLETGDLVRRGAHEHFGTPTAALSSDQLGEYSTHRREVDGGDYVAQDVVDELDANDEFPESPAIVTGMRDTESPGVFEDYFDHYEIVWVHAAFDTRLARLQGRNRQDEAAFTKEDLKRRDGRESMWGTADLAFLADHRVGNEKSIGDLRETIVEVVL